MMSISDAFLAMQTTTFLQTSLGGTIVLYSGAAAPRNDPPAPERVMATIPIDSGTFVQQDDAVTVTNVSGKVRAPGRLAYFVVLTSARVPLVGGAIGVGVGDLRLNRLDLLAEDTVTITKWTLRFAQAVAAR